MSIMTKSFNSKKSQVDASNTKTSSFMRGTSATGNRKIATGVHQSRAGKSMAAAKNPMSNPELGRAPAQPAESGPLKSLTAPRKGITTVFPLNVRAVDHYMTIGAYEETFFPAFGGSRPNRTILQKVILPMPSNLVAGYGQEYQNEQIGQAGQIAGKAFAAQDTTKFVESVENIFDKKGNPFTEAFASTKEAALLTKNVIKAVGEDIGKGAALASALKIAESGIAAAVTTGTIGIAPGLAAAAATKGLSAAVASKGIAANPHLAVIYDSPQLRSFQFDWELRPKNQQESIAIARIVAFLKYYSAPSFRAETQNHFFDYPNQFKLKIKHDEFLFSFGDCVLTNFAVDYHGEGTPIYYDAAGSIRSGNRRLKAPAVVRISTAWQETSIVTKGAIEKQGR